MRFPLSDKDFEFQTDDVSLTISRSQPKKETGRVKMTWQGASTRSLRDAFATKAPVELALVISSGEPEFSVYIDDKRF